MTMTKIEQVSNPQTKKSFFIEILKFGVLFFLRVSITALGQPDRGLFFSGLSYIIGYSSAFYLLFRIPQKTLKFVFAFFWMFFVQCCQLDWLATTKYHGKSIVIVYLCLSAGIALQFAFLSWFLPKKGNLTLMRCASMASFWTLLEVSRLYVLCGFPFNSTGLVMTSHPMMMQMAALFGIYGLSFWVIFTSSIGVKAFVQKSIGYSCLWVALLVSPLVFGFFHMNYHDKKALLQNHLAVALIQTGLEVEQKWPFPKHEETYIDPFIQWKMIFDMLSSTQHKAYDLIVLPEVALPGNAYYPDIDYERALRDIIKEDSRLPALIEPLAARDSKGNWKVSHAWMAQAIANRFKSELVVGLLDVDDELEESYNSAFHFVPFRTSIHRYEKRVLVPLAEYLPLPVMKSFLEEYGITSFFTPGKKAKVFYGNVPLAVSICYEEGYSNLIREARILGAKLLVNVTNDGWFPKSRLPQEHYNLGVLRSIENGVPVVRACNTGITAAIDSLGRVQGVMQDVGKDGETLGGVVTASLGLYSYTTLFSIAGNNLIVLISTLVLLLFFFYRKPLSF